MTANDDLVDLPDPAVQPLVHPLDLAEARRQFRTSWLIDSLTHPAISLCLAALIWFASHNYVAPVLAGAALIGFGALASRQFAIQAWAYIPVQRQDRDRELPVTWHLVSSLGFALALAAALLLVVWRLAQPDVPADVRDVMVGMGVAIGLMAIGDVARNVVRHRRNLRRTLATLLPVAALIAAVLVAVASLPAGAGNGGWARSLWGFAAMLVAGGVVGAWKYLTLRRAGT